MIAKLQFLALFGLILGTNFKVGAQDSSLFVHQELTSVQSNNFRFQPDTCSYIPLYVEMGKWMGTKYRYAGCTDKGIDCSGLVKQLFANVYGKKLDGGSANIFNAVQMINEADLKEGDLVFYITRNKRISHVGLYLRDGYFVHATTHNGVIISHRDEPYYAKRFGGAGRLK